ncbi:amino acid permease [Vagococcus vulneris]|uniref:Glutamate:gamma-aminobutyrate antiporter n=1 Tax=Vagococcus vulneris TaxID=1977869 RepID=A0A429ZSV6_9ENTE|nr:amino acid permease [Vagococcus vulneris]RST96743.1 glutamate:gamma-aminobutyrate antiporter [Vagococcus vulneris]
MTQEKKKLSLFSFFAMTASLFITVYEYPTFAESGKTLIFFLLLCGLFWFLPVALCSAELATIKGYQEGGIFGWVGKLLGEKYGFAAIFFQWFQVTVGFVTMIYFIIGSLSYVLDFKEMNSNPVIKYLCILLIFWVLTFLQFRGTEFSAKLAKYGFVLGIIVPVVILLIMTVKYVGTGHQINPRFVQDQTFLPKPKEFPQLVSFVLAYMGVEASAPHITELDNPKKNYPLIMFLLVIVGVLLSTIGGSAVSMVVPGKLNLDSGVVDAFKAVIGSKIIVKLMAILVSFGVMAQVSSWIVSPTEGLRVVAEKNLLPDKFKQVNKNKVPTFILVIQGFLVSAWGAVLTFGGGGGGSNVSFLTAISLTVIIYLSAYVLFFIAYFVLILKKSNQSLERAYTVPGGKLMQLIIAGCGLIISVLAICLSFISPSELKGSAATTYVMTLSISFVITVAVPFLFYKFYSLKKKTKAN